MEQDGWQCVFANDICKDKKETYVANFDDEHFYLEDVWELTGKLDALPDSAFLTTASFPCTDLSVAGARKGLKGAQSGTLHAFIEIVELLKKDGRQPPMIMLENVQGFLTSHQGKDVAYTVNELNRLGYVVDIIELDAKHFTPQSRPRVFVFAVVDELAKAVMNVDFDCSPLSAWWQKFNQHPECRTKKIRDVITANPDCSWGLFDLPSLPVRQNSLSDIIEMLPDDSAYWWSAEKTEKLYSQMSDKHKEVLHQMMQGRHFSYGTIYRRIRQGQTRAELRTDGIAGCLRTPKGGSSKQIVIRAGNGSFSVRFLTPREYARLQGVDDSYVLPSRDTAGYFAMGDAVCVPALHWISTNILSNAYNEWVRLELSKAA
ncbi:DNA (cytosine-5-)-methyltransferase [Vibrio cholerae]|nr:DNA (cytosine-5-)-methyltransferase [Vibrio cholerae]